ncbi:MAG: hypothetical protein QG567_1237, partial [Campylobacterota bacterium]|nr:hypothetical protein [Campylobacterota bacterium]
DAKEIVLDTYTKLMWQDNLEAKTVEKNWQGAIDYCSNLTLAGFDDWRLPDEDTFSSLYSKKDDLTNLSSVGYWSSSPNVSDADRAWLVTLFYGYGSLGL